MKKFFVYFAGGLACLAVGIIFYISAINFTPESKSLALPENNGFKKQMGTVLDLLDSKLPKTGAEVVVLLPEKITSIFFAGDIMLGRDVAVKIFKNGSDFPFSKIKDFVSSASFAISNLEGPLTKINNDPNNDMRFHFDPNLVQILSAAGFDAFSLANNHGLDQGQKGYTETKEYLQLNGLKYFGEVDTDNGQVLHVETNGKKIAVIGLHDVYRKIDASVVQKLIAVEKQTADIVIIYPHWGDEYSHKANKRQIFLAHSFIDSGADLVIGSHPHVIEGIESYKGKLIFYSLGNLVFDQYFSTDSQEGLALNLNIGTSGLQSIDLLPYKLPQSQPAFVDGQIKKNMLGKLASWSDVGLKDSILAGRLEKF